MDESEEPRERSRLPLPFQSRADHRFIWFSTSNEQVDNLSSMKVKGEDFSLGMFWDPTDRRREQSTFMLLFSEGTSRFGSPMGKNLGLNNQDGYPRNDA